MYMVELVKFTWQVTVLHIRINNTLVVVVDRGTEKNRTFYL